MKKVIEWQHLGMTPYAQGLRIQKQLWEERKEGHIPDRLLLLEHHPVFTMGRRDCSTDFISSEKEIRGCGIDIVKTDRGGKVTYHGPGQLVGYFICDVAGLRMGIKHFVAAIEELCMRTLTPFGIVSTRDEEHPGLWVGRNKIVAIGLSVPEGITQHGFALNVSTNLKAYRHIISCGIRERGVTSIEQLTKKIPPMKEVIDHLISSAGEVLGHEFLMIDSPAQAETKVGKPFSTAEFPSEGSS